MSKDDSKPSVIQTEFDAKITKDTSSKEDLISRMNEAELEQKLNSKPILLTCDFLNT